MIFAWYIIVIILLMATILQFFPYRHWIYRVPEYLNRQIAWGGLVAFIFGLFLYEHSFVHILFILLSLFVLIRNSVKVFPYTRFGKKSLECLKKENASWSISLLVINVYQFNTAYSRAVDCIRKSSADLVLLVETDKQWTSEVLESVKHYPYHISIPRDDTYGMMLLSRYKLHEKNIRQIYDETVSITCQLKLNNRTIHVYGLHPKPPAPTEASTSLPKDVELSVIAQEIAALPKDELVIVMGDLNDVAWSKTTQNFITTSGLEDPRKGRGLIVTFPSYLPFFGFPLDQIICSPNFKVIQVNRMPPIGSDHFPLFVCLGID